LPTHQPTLVAFLWQLLAALDTDAKLRSLSADPLAVAEFSRIGNNIQQISRAAPAALSSATHDLVKPFAALFKSADNDAFRANLANLRIMRDRRDTPHPQSWQQFQNSGTVRTSRSDPPTLPPRPRPQTQPAPDSGSSFLGRLFKS
jgi:hypothetical protein